jgi:DNA-binding XRE family transcriptional regulator
MAMFDHFAARELRRLREDHGYSPEALASAIEAQALTAPWGSTHGTVHAHTIRRIEDLGHRPRLRVQFVLAQFFGVRHTDIWRSEDTESVRERRQEVVLR